MQRIAVYCASNEGRRPVFREATEALGQAMVRRQIDGVYGGAATGLMGSIADTLLAGGCEVIGVIPTWMVDREIAHERLTQLYVVDTMHERKAKMAELADGFIGLPGGYGTLDEMFEVLGWAQLHLHDKPVAFLDVDGYFVDLFRFLDRAVDEGLLKAHNRAIPLYDTDPERLLDAMQAFQPTHADSAAIDRRA